MPTPEGAVQKSIIDYCRLKQILITKHRNVGIYKKSTDSYIPLPDLERGVSDLIGCLKGGRYLAIEVKAPGKKPSPEQLAFLAKVNAQGGVGFWADSLEMAINSLAPYL